jgi:hypothetical protein
MSRDLDPALEAAIGEPVVKPFLAVRIELPDPVYVWTGRGTLVFNDADGGSHNWLGAGEAGAIEPIGESTDGSATGIRVVLLSVPSQFQLADGTWMSDYLEQQAERGVVFEVYAGALNEIFPATVEAVQLIWKGRLDTYKITDGGATLSVEITGESRGIDQQRPAIKRFTDEYQQRKYPGDRFFEYVPQMTEVSILWAAADPSGTGLGAILGGGGGFFDGLARHIMSK